MEHLRGKLALVTGIGTEIGTAIASELAREGADLIVAERDDVVLDAATRSADFRQAIIAQCVFDVRHPGQWAEMGSKYTGEFGPIDLLLNFQGWLATPELPPPTLSIREAFDTCVLGNYNGIRAFLTQLRRPESQTQIIGSGLGNHAFSGPPDSDQISAQLLCDLYSELRRDLKESQTFASLVLPKSAQSYFDPSTGQSAKLSVSVSAGKQILAAIRADQFPVFIHGPTMSFH